MGGSSDGLAFGTMYSILPSLRTEGGPSEASSWGPEFATAFRALQATWTLHDPRLLAAAKEMDRGRAKEAKRALSRLLAQRPGNPDVLYLMAEIASLEGQHQEAESLLARCVQSSATSEFYRYNYVRALERLSKLDSALAETEILLRSNPRNLIFLDLKASLLKKTGGYIEAADRYRALAQDYPENSYIWNGLGAALRDLGGHREECTQAFLKAAALNPSRGRIWWNLACLGTFRFSDAHIAQMESALSRPPLSAEDRAELLCALGKAYDDAKDYRRAFENYARGNAIRRVSLDYNPDATSAMVVQTEGVFTPEIFRARTEAGCLSREPIFVVGMQRAGSTLVEQILGSHPQIEGLGELNFILKVAGDELRPKSGPKYPHGLDQLDPADLQALGEKYLSYANLKRRTGKPFFVDKCPYNFWHVGLIRLILPNAKIIDARRHPMACCFANFTMSFAFGPPLSYKQTEIGRFYADYVRLMAHFDRVQPGKIYRVIYERLVEDLETEVRGVLDFLELPFEQSCLEYYATDRSFNSLSSEQVRSPIFREGVDRWRNYEQWLGPLKASLGPVLDAYPDAPEFYSNLS
jgi:tetratricopeptide (TPR) repeat protein